MSNTPETQTSPSANLISAFAETQSLHLENEALLLNSFIAFACSAFFYGAIGMLRKQSDLAEAELKLQAIKQIAKMCHISERIARDSLQSVEAYAKRYYLVENIVEQGESAANSWLNCEEGGVNQLQSILTKYKDLTMFDLGLEGVNEDYQLQQQEMLLQVDESVVKLRRRTLFLGLYVVGVIFATMALLHYFLD